MARSFVHGRGVAPDQIRYSQDMRELVEYARARGVRVMPEFDVPGHGSWGMGYPALMGCWDAGVPGTSKPNGVLDPTNPDVYEFLHTFLEVRMHCLNDVWREFSGGQKGGGGGGGGESEQ